MFDLLLFIATMAGMIIIAIGYHQILELIGWNPIDKAGLKSFPIFLACETIVLGILIYILCAGS